jgi:hypothetical protein
MPNPNVYLQAIHLTKGKVSMDRDLVQLIFFIIIGLFSLISVLRRRQRQQSEPEVVLEEEDEISLPPWANLPPMEGEVQPPLRVESEMPPTMEPESPPVVPTGELTIQMPSHREVLPDELERRPEREDRFDTRAPEVGTIAGIPLSPQTFRQGIILSEILGRPKSLRRPR